MKFLRKLLLPLLSILLVTGNQTLGNLYNYPLGVSSSVKHTTKADVNARDCAKQGGEITKGVDKLKSKVLTTGEQAKIVGGGNAKVPKTGNLGGNISKNVKKLEDSYLKKKGIDAHAFKEKWVGEKNISRYNIHRNTDTGELILIPIQSQKLGPVATGKILSK